MIIVYALLVTLSLAAMSGRSIAHLGQVKIAGSHFILGCFAVQAVAIALPVTDDVVVTIRTVLIVATQLGLVGIGLQNVRLHGFPLLLVGLALNTLVMLANGGLMPITPETFQHARPSIDVSTRPLGAALVYTKDILLLREDTVLWALSDRIVLPPIPVRSAVSVGDVLIAGGIAMFLWQATSPGRARRHELGVL